jgi:hypothetical protein
VEAPPELTMPLITVLLPEPLLGQPDKVRMLRNTQTPSSSFEFLQDIKFTFNCKDYYS